MKIGLLCVLVSFITLSVGSALSESLTYDEVFYLEEGREILSGGPISDPYNPPLVPILAGLPIALGWDAWIRSPIPAHKAFFSRMTTVVLGGILILAVYRAGGLTAAWILAFEPTFLANSHYVTSDVAVALFVFLAAVSPNTWLVGLSVGYALSSKITSLLFLPIVWFFKTVPYGFARPVPAKSGRIVLVAVIILWATHLFTWDVVIGAREDSSRVSKMLVEYARIHRIFALEGIVKFFEEQPLPLGTYLATVKNNLLRLGRPATVIFDGKLYERPRWYFMIANVLRKVPVPLLILIALGAGYRQNYAGIGMAIILVVSVVGMVPLVRFALPAMPFFAVVAGGGIKKIGETGGIWGKRIVFVLLLWYVVGTLRQYPHFISYANEFVRPSHRFEVLSDSNLDWGQALPDITRFARDNVYGRVSLSYFGRDDATVYGFASDTAYGGWKFEDICAFHESVINPKVAQSAEIISISNWYACGYNTRDAYRKDKIREVVADAFLVF